MLYICCVVSFIFGSDWLQWNGCICGVSEVYVWVVDILWVVGEGVLVEQWFGEFEELFDEFEFWLVMLCEGFKLGVMVDVVYSVTVWGDVCGVKVMVKGEENAW